MIAKPVYSWGPLTQGVMTGLLSVIN